MRPLEFKMECQIFEGVSSIYKGIQKELVDFGVFENTINIKHGDYPEIIIDKDIAKAILQKILKLEEDEKTLHCFTHDKYGNLIYVEKEEK